MAAIGLFFAGFGSSGTPSARGAGELVVDAGSTGGPCDDARAPDEVSAGQPWCTLQRAITAAPDGAVVTVRGGDYGAPKLSAERSDVQLRAASGEEARLGGLSFTGGGVRFQGFTLTGPVGIEPGSHDIGFLDNTFRPGGIAVQQGVQRLLIERNFFTTPRGNAIIFSADSTDPYVTDVTIRRNRFDDIGVAGVNIRRFKNVTVEGNEFSKVHSWDGNVHPDVIRTFAGGRGLRVVGNYIHNNRAQGVFIKDGHVDDVLIANNLIVKNAGPWLPVNIYDTGGVRLVNNTIVDNGNTVLLNDNVDDAELRNNILASFKAENPKSVVYNSFNLIGGRTTSTRPGTTSGGTTTSGSGTSTGTSGGSTSGGSTSGGSTSGGSTSGGSTSGGSTSGGSTSGGSTSGGSTSGGSTGGGSTGGGGSTDGGDSGGSLIPPLPTMPVPVPTTSITPTAPSVDLGGTQLRASTAMKGVLQRAAASLRAGITARAAQSAASSDSSGTTATVAFVDSSGADYRLDPKGAGVDQGTSDGAPDTDIYGQPRVDVPQVPNRGGGADPYVDVGAIETQTDVAKALGQGGAGGGSKKSGINADDLPSGCAFGVGPRDDCWLAVNTTRRQRLMKKARFGLRVLCAVECRISVSARGTAGKRRKVVTRAKTLRPRALGQWTQVYVGFGRKSADRVRARLRARKSVLLILTVRATDQQGRKLAVYKAVRIMPAKAKKKSRR